MNLSRAVDGVTSQPPPAPPCRPLSRMQSPQFRAFVVAEEGKLSVPSRGESLVGWHGAAGIVKGQGIRNLLRFFVSVWLGTRAYFNINL